MKARLFQPGFFMALPLWYRDFSLHEFLNKVAFLTLRPRIALLRGT